MKQIAKNMILLAAMLMVASCTTNNGDIGPWFGTWRVTEITTDGVADADYQGNMFFKFQSTVFEMLLVHDDHGTENRFGIWNDDGKGTLTELPRCESRTAAPKPHEGRAERAYVQRRAVVGIRAKA